MLDKMAMITMLILYIIFTLMALFTYLIVRGGSMNKTPQEKLNDEEDAMNYFKDLKNGGK